MYRPGRRWLSLLLAAALLAVIFLAVSYSSLRMERGATSHLDEGDDRQGPVPSPVAEPGPATGADDTAAGDNGTDVVPVTLDDDDAPRDELPRATTPGPGMTGEGEENDERQ